MVLRHFGQTGRAGLFYSVTLGGTAYSNFKTDRKK